MSVPKGKRGQSSAEFIHTARELVIVTMRRCKKYPKAYTFYLAVPTVECAMRLHHLVMTANFYPTNDHEWQMRIDMLIEAMGELRELTALIEIGHEAVGIEPSKLEAWAGLVEKERALLKSLIESDRNRRKKLMDNV